MAEEQAEKEGENQEAPADTKPKGKKKLMLIAGGVMLLLAVVIGVMLSGGKEEAEEEGGEHEAEEEQHLAHAELDPPFIVNLSVSSTYLKVKIIVEYNEAALGAEGAAEEGGGGHGEGGGGAPPGILGKRYPMIRDAILTLLGSKTAEDLLSPEGKEDIKTELIDTINEAIGADEQVVSNIYFQDFIIQ